MAAGGVLIVGLTLRLALGGGGEGDRSAMVMTALLSVGAWLATLLLSTPRTAFLATLGLVALLDLAALPEHDAPGYDHREAFFQTDQLVTARVPVPPSVSQSQPNLTLLVEPVFPASAKQPRFGLAGEVGSSALAWDCAFQRGIQKLALPVPANAVLSSGQIDARLHLTGSPSREADYLVVYASAPRGGFLVSLVGAAEVDRSATTCALRS